jgi:rsbT antagonist protein RsbS
VAVPILKHGRILIASIQTALADSEWDEFRDTLLAKVGLHRSSGVIIDVSAMDVMDSFSTRTLRGLSLMVRLRGADTVIVGIQPEVAQAMAQLGLRLDDAVTALDLEEGLEILATRAASDPRGRRDG